MEMYKSSEITVHKLNELRLDDKNIQILDVREDTERNHASVEGTIHIKLTEIADRHSELDKYKNMSFIHKTTFRGISFSKHGKNYFWNWNKSNPVSKTFENLSPTQKYSFETHRIK